MARFCGIIGYRDQREIRPSVHKSVITERRYFGDVVRNIRKLDGGNQINDNLSVNNLISVVADPYAFEHFFDIVYVEWMGSRWKVTSVEVQRPRLILTLGGLYNGNETGTGSEAPG